MLALLKASFFKLRHDLTLKITLIIGLALSVLLTGLYFLIDVTMASGCHIQATGQNMLLNSFSPTQNFGIAIPINLAIFTIGEFNQGTIRNKVVVGNSKLKIYLSLLITGLLFTFALLVSYVGLSTLLGTIFGRGFFPNYRGTSSDVDSEIIKGMVKQATVKPNYIFKFIIGGCLAYITITSYSVFCSTLVKHIGPAIPLIIVPTIFLTLAPLILGSLASVYPEYINMANEALANGNNEDYAMFIGLANEFKTIYDIDVAVQFIDPFYLIGKSSLTSLSEEATDINNNLFYGCIVSNVSWSVIFTCLGLLIFNKRDLK